MKDKSVSAQNTPDIFTKKAGHGGLRVGKSRPAHRPKKYSENTKTVRVIESAVEFVPVLNTGKLLPLIEHYKEKCEPYMQKPSGKRGAFRHMCQFLIELDELIENGDE